jgi:GT2 family glycosyltransferase
MTTISSLEHLFACSLPDDTELTVFLVDDASPDGSGDVVRRRFPAVNVIRGTGSLYWSGGRRRAWDEATQRASFDAFLWLNDDTRLFSGAVEMLDNTAREVRDRMGRDPIVVGATLDTVSNKTSYGALSDAARAPSGVSTPFTETETINGNVVWVPRAVWEQIGNLSSRYTHAMGDTDYGLRARRLGVPIWLTPEHVGACRTNTARSWRDPSVSLLARLRALHSPKGCPPSEYVHIVRLMHPNTWPLHVLNLYRRVLFP